MKYILNALLIFITFGISYAGGFFIAPYVSQMIQSKSIANNQILNVLGVNTIPTPTSVPIPTPTPTMTPTQFGERLIELVNGERKKAGLKAVKENGLLNKAAKAKSEDMIAKNYWSHISPQGIKPWSFVKKVGYKYLYCAENLSRYFYSPEDTIQAWMNSEEHRTNILNASYTETGIYVLYDEYYWRNLVVNFFGTPLNL